VDDIISGHLTPTVMALFDGIDVTGKSIVCFVQDRRQSIALDYLVVLGAEKSSDFRVKHTKRLAESIRDDDLLTIKARAARSSGGECRRPAE
jgi:hypothetical protein